MRIQKVIEGGSSIADPLAQTKRVVVARGKFWKRGERGAQTGGLVPSASYTKGPDWMEKAANSSLTSLGLGAIGGGLQNMALNVNPAFVGYVGTPTTTATSSTPSITYSTAGSASTKSYSPAGMLGKK